jgi:phage terminase large subunit-like protein
MHRVTAYASQVVAGEIVAGRLVRLACQRHLDDLRDGGARGLHFDEAKADRAIQFVERFCRLAGGEHEGRPFLLQPWQAFIFGSLFGWMRDDVRRFRTAYVEAAKGNGKSPLAAAVGLYMLVADDEPRAEVYAAATKKEQAMVLFRDAVAMVEQSPSLAARVAPSGVKGREWLLTHAASGSFFKPIANDSGQSGPRPHCGLIDEIHEHKDSTVLDLLEKGVKGRRQPLMLEITNSGHDRHSVCWQHHDYSERILEGVERNDSWFAYVCSLDTCAKCKEAGLRAPSDECPDCDSWADEGVWPKANPNLGVSITPEYLRREVEKAKGMPAKEGVTKRLNFCVWTEGGSARAIDLELWDRGGEPFDIEELRGRTCYGGMDLAKTCDLSALALLFPPLEEDEPWKVLCWFWIPEDDIRQRSKRDKVPYEVWLREGLVDSTPGNATDYDWIEAAILDLSSTYDIREIGFDRTFAGEITRHLTNQGIMCVQFGQGFLSMGPAADELIRKLKAGRLQHGGNPVLRWCVRNAAMVGDAAGNLKPDKQKSTERIDGLVALLMAVGRAQIMDAGGEADDVGGCEAC